MQASYSRLPPIECSELCRIVMRFPIPGEQLTEIRNEFLNKRMRFEEKKKKGKEAEKTEQMTPTDTDEWSQV